MKKQLLAIVIIASIFIFTSASYETPADSRIGYNAPGFAVENDESAVELQSMRGKYVLVSFWSSTDAESRIANITYDRMARNHKELSFVAVNYDPSEAVYGEIVKIDNLRVGAQFHDSEGSASKIYKAYRLDEGYCAMLISPEGKIVAINPSEETIETYIGWADTFANQKEPHRGSFFCFYWPEFSCTVLAPLAKGGDVPAVVESEGVNKFCTKFSSVGFFM